MSIKKPTYIGCDKNTLIKDIPSIINKNNEENNRLFGDIFEFGSDSANQQYIKVPVITKGIVKGTSGQFYNLYANNIFLSQNALSNSFQNIVVKHNLALDRFKDKSLESSIYSHDADSILYDAQNTIKSKINEIENSIKNVTDIDDKYETRFLNIEKEIEDIKGLLNIIASNLNINNEFNAPNTMSLEVNENEELIKALNEPTSSYTYSSGHYKNNN